MHAEWLVTDATSIEAIAVKRLCGLTNIDAGSCPLVWHRPGSANAAGINNGR
jgi:hypothetical protein